VVLVYLQIAIHINAVGLGAMTLLGHATWLLAQLLLSVAPRREDSIDGKTANVKCNITVPHCI